MHQEVKYMSAGDIWQNQQSVFKINKQPGS